MSYISKVELFENGPDLKKFTKEELNIFDADGFTRNYLKINLSELTDDYYEAIADILKHQYCLPMKYLQAIRESCSYVSQKAIMSDANKDIKNADVTIEPLNADFVYMIQYTPINQSIPLGTIVNLNVKIPFDYGEDNKEPERKFIWSSNLQTDKDIEAKIKSENPKSIRTKPWMECVHYGAVDIGSEIQYKYIVSEVNTKIIQSFSLFGFRRYDPKKEFIMWVFKCYNLKPIDVLNLMLKCEDLKEVTKTFIHSVIKHAK